MVSNEFYRKRLFLSWVSIAKSLWSFQYLISKCFKKFDTKMRFDLDIVKQRSLLNLRIFKNLSLLEAS